MSQTVQLQQLWNEIVWKVITLNPNSAEKLYNVTSQTWTKLVCKNLRVIPV